MKKNLKKQVDNNQQLSFDFNSSTKLSYSNPVNEARIIHLNPRKEIYCKILNRR